MSTSRDVKTLPVDFPLVSSANHCEKSFTERLEPEALEYFNNICKKPFTDQVISFLNAYWRELSNEAEFIYSVTWKIMRDADMHFKGIFLIHNYEEGSSLDFDAGLYFYEQLCKFCDDEKNIEWKTKYPASQPEMLTALRRKQELRERVDVNFDGRVSILECLLYQYRDLANPSDFCSRSMTYNEHPEITKARRMLENVNLSIRKYEDERLRLTEESKLPGVKGLAALNLLAQIESSSLKNELNKDLITAQAALRIASRKCGVQVQEAGVGSDRAGPIGNSSDGAIWWMSRDLEEKKRKYGPKVAKP